MVSTQRWPAEHYLLAVFVLLLCGGALAASPARYLSVSIDTVINSKTQLNCYDPDTTIPASSGNRLAIHPACSGGSEKAWRQRDILVHDNARLSTLLQRSTSSVIIPVSFAPASAPAEAPSATIPDRPGTYLDTLEFVVIVGFGTPAQSSAIIFDTGSDVSWIQCQPCTGHCYQQHDPLFDPSKSSTYSVVPCGTPACSVAGGNCNGTTCLYTVHYGDGSSTSGALSQETLTFTSARTFSGFTFGCGTTNLGDFGEVDGLLGLGRGHFSLPSQTTSSFGGSFSYCMPSFNTTPGYLTIGSTPVTGKVQFKFTMKGNKPAPAFDILDTCYDFSGQSAIFIPAVSLIFSDGGVFDLNFYGILIFPDDTQPAIGCLAFVGNPDGAPLSIIGNTQQRSTEVIYDVGAERIGFVPFSC
ncbi:aspartyl protease family protein At5g10770-like [Lolium perenne]|uniref:aspartyl protease family protein At5g10770-like n=1 Tax=Lolium perenne TaxID=4522 RepID=UPI003A997D98